MLPERDGDVWHGFVEPGEAYGRRGEALGLKWRDEEWAQQSRHQDSITEQELRDTLTKENWLIQVCRAVRRLGGILENSPDLPDDHEAMGAGWYIPWTLPEWRDGRTTLYVRDIRLSDDEVAALVQPDSAPKDRGVTSSWLRPLCLLRAKIFGSGKKSRDVHHGTCPSP